MTEVTFLDHEPRIDGDIDSYRDISNVLLNSETPSVFFNRVVLKEGFAKKFPWLVDMIGTIQNPQWHNEGDVWNHTMMALDLAALKVKQMNMFDDDKLVFMYAVLYHDSAKSLVTQKVVRNKADGTAIERQISHAHDMKGGELVEETLHDFVDDRNNEVTLRKKIRALVETHMRPGVVYDRHLGGEKKDKMFKKLKKKLDESGTSTGMLMLLVEVDKRARGVVSPLEVTQVEKLEDMIAWFKLMSDK